MRDTYNEQADSNFAKAYLAALQSIIRFDEQLAGARLNKVAAIMAPYVKADMAPRANTAEAAIFTELKNNRIMERGCLYGDYQSNEKTPWLRDPILLGMIKSHVELLGNPDDKEALKTFLERTEAFYGTDAKPAKPFQRALSVVA